MELKQVFEKSDQQLIEKALKGNRRAWLSLVKRYETQVYQYGVRMTGSREDGLDLMQEVFVSVFRNLSGYRAEGSFRGWLFKIAHFRCIEFYRRRKPNQGLDDIPEVASQDPCMEAVLSAQQQSASLLMAMQQLPLSQRAVVELKFFGQFTFGEIAQQLGISDNTAKSRLYSGLAKLKEYLEVEYA